jgi:sugar lactone lactonase YvrE
VFVSNNQSTTVVAYHPGETKPFETLTGFGAPLGLAFDRAGNLFVGDERFGSTGCLWEVKHGSNHPKRLDLEIRYPIGVAVDSHENLYVTGETSQPEVAVYRLDQRKPVRVITSGLMSPFMIALTAQNALLAADNAAIDVVEYAFGQDVPEKTYSKDLKSPFGVAVLSPPTPGRQ